jgi:hypothetical protein
MNVPGDPVPFEDLADPLPAQSITLAEHFKDYPLLASGDDPSVPSGIRTFKGIHRVPTSPA